MNRYEFTKGIIESAAFLRLPGSLMRASYFAQKVQKDAKSADFLQQKPMFRV